MIDSYQVYCRDVGRACTLSMEKYSKQNPGRSSLIRFHYGISKRVAHRVLACHLLALFPGASSEQAPSTTERRTGYDFALISPLPALRSVGVIHPWSIGRLAHR